MTLPDLSLGPLQLFGLAALSFSLLCYALEGRGRGWTLGFAAGCVGGAVYGFLEGAWPFGVVEVVWAVVAVVRWRRMAAQ